MLPVFWLLAFLGSGLSRQATTVPESGHPLVDGSATEMGDKAKEPDSESAGTEHRYFPLRIDAKGEVSGNGNSMIPGTHENLEQSGLILAPETTNANSTASSGERVKGKDVDLSKSKKDDSTVQSPQLLTTTASQENDEVMMPFSLSTSFSFHGPVLQASKEPEGVPPIDGSVLHPVLSKNSSAVSSSLTNNNTSYLRMTNDKRHRPHHQKSNSSSKHQHKNGNSINSDLGKNLSPSDPRVEYNVSNAAITLLKFIPPDIESVIGVTGKSDYDTGINLGRSRKSMSHTEESASLENSAVTPLNPIGTSSQFSNKSGMNSSSMHIASTIHDLGPAVTDYNPTTVEPKYMIRSENSLEIIESLPVEKETKHDEEYSNRESRQETLQNKTKTSLQMDENNSPLLLQQERNNTESDPPSRRFSENQTSGVSKFGGKFLRDYGTIRPQGTETPVSSRTTNISYLAAEKVDVIMDKWKKLEKKFRVRSNSVLKKILPKIMKYRSKINITSKCAVSMIQLVRGLKQLDSWAVKMIDASGGFPSGSLEGTLTDLGDYDECLAIKRPSRNRGPEVKGQYCTVRLKPMLPSLHQNTGLPSQVLGFVNVSKDSVLSELSRSSVLFHIMVLRVGICTPSSCSPDDISQLISTVFEEIPVNISVKGCEIVRAVHLSVKQIAVISAMASIVILIAAGTACDVGLSRKEKKSPIAGRWRKSICAFSLKTNIRQLFETTSGPNTLDSVNGIRFLSLMWIIVGHTYGFGHRQGFAHLKNAKSYTENIAFQIISNGWVSVDTFFMLGGLLVAISNLRAMENTRGKIAYISYVLHRIWRLTPPVAATVGVMFLLPLIGSGPLWADMMGRKVANCEQKWWQPILMLNSWLEFDSSCLLHTWYVSADLQFYCLAPLALVLLYRWPFLGLAALLLMTALCSLATGLLTLLYHLQPTVIFFSPDVELTKKTANLIYFRPYPHMGAYCVGIILGYIVWKHKKYPSRKVTQIFGWCTSIVCCLSVLFATYPWNQGRRVDPVAEIIYSVLHRTVWAAGVAWVIFMCATNRAGVINQFLSWKIFIPLSRLCYSMFLLHFPVLWVRVSWRRTLVNFHHYDIVTEFLGILMITMGLSIIFHVAFEAPFLKLENTWFPRKSYKTKNQETEVKIVK